MFRKISTGVTSAIGILATLSLACFAVMIFIRAAASVRPNQPVQIITPLESYVLSLAVKLYLLTFIVWLTLLWLRRAKRQFSRWRVERKLNKMYFRPATHEVKREICDAIYTEP